MKLHCFLEQCNSNQKQSLVAEQHSCQQELYSFLIHDFSHQELYCFLEQESSHQKLEC